MPHVTLRDGESLQVRVLGRGQPVLLLHGLGMQGRHWLPFVWPYLHRFRFYLPDLRGHGASSQLRLNQADVFQNHMEDVQDLIAHFGLRDFLLGGISLGGSTALHLQRAGGFTTVRRYLHIDQSPCVGNREDWTFGLYGERQAEFFAGLQPLLALLDEHAHIERLEALPASARRAAMSILADTFANILGQRALAPVMTAAGRWPWLLPHVLPLLHVQDLRAYLASYLGGGHDYRDSLRGCLTPITVMVGMRSPLYAPQGQMAIADYAPVCRVVRLEKSGHAPLLDQPLRFTRELGRFLQAA